MKFVLFLFTGSDSAQAEQLTDYLQGKLRNKAVLRSVTDILAEKKDFKKVLHRSDCVVLIGSRQALSLIQNKQQETKGRFITFDGKVLHDEFTENKELVEKLVVVFFAERTKNDWIPIGLDEKRVFNLQGEKIGKGNPALSHLEYSMRRVLGETVLDW